jgi:hypothetical protein
MDGTENIETPQESPENNQAGEPTRPSNSVDVVEKLRMLGVDPNDLVRTLIIPVIDQIEEKRAKALDVKIARVIEEASARASEKAATNFTAMLNEQLKGAGSTPLSSSHEQQTNQNTEVVTSPRVGSNGAIEALLPVILKMFTGRGVASADGGLAQMAQSAKNVADFMKTVMQPIVEMQATMRQSVLQEMTTYSKTGGELPWEREVIKALPEPKTTANLTQEDRNRIILDLAKRIRV